MGIFGTFLALGWIGSNLIKEGFDQRKLDKQYNDSHKDSRIYQRDGKYYDSVTGKRVIETYRNDRETGKTFKVWQDLYDYNPDHFVYEEGREKWNKDNDEWDSKIKAIQLEKNPVYLREAEENNLRFAKYVLPHTPGSHLVQEGYIDRLEKVNNESERTFYLPEREYRMNYLMRSARVNHNNVWASDGGYLCYKPYGGIFAYLDDKYEEG